MKTIYSSHIGKVKISDKTLFLVDEAVKRVEELSKENKWKPSLEIYLKKGRNNDWHPGEPTGDAIVRVDIDSWTDDNVHSQVMRTLEGKIPHGRTKVDLGYYGYEGWETAIELNDLRKLPNLYFEYYFISTLFELHTTVCAESYKEIEKDHWKLIVPQIHETASRELKEAKERPIYDKDETNKKSNSYLENVVKTTRDFSKGKTSLGKLIKALKNKPKFE